MAYYCYWNDLFIYCFRAVLQRKCIYVHCLFGIFLFQCRFIYACKVITMEIPIPFFGWFIDEDDMTTFTTEDRVRAQIDYDYADAFLRMKTLMKKYHQ